MRKALVPEGFEEFNFHRLEGKGLTAQTLTETVEAMPMMAQRTLVQVVDWDLFKLAEDQRSLVVALLEDLPDYCCLVLVYDQVEYKPNRSYKKLCSTGRISSGCPAGSGPWATPLTPPRRSTCSSPAAA